MLLTHVVVTSLSCLLSFLDKLYIPYFKKLKDFLFTCLLSFLLPKAIIVALEIIVGNTCVYINSYCHLSFLLPEAIIVALEIIVGNTCVSILIVI